MGAPSERVAPISGSADTTPWADRYHCVAAPMMAVRRSVENDMAVRKRLKRPTKINMEPLIVLAVRGPKDGCQGSWYWRAELHRDGVTRTVWCGWATRTATRMAANLVADNRLQEPSRRARVVRSVRDLLEV